jgi:hypothetical protein
LRGDPNFPMALDRSFSDHSLRWRLLRTKL